MPNFNGTGPNGKGPMTGCGRGYCILPITIPEQELDFLKNQEHVLEEQLRQIKARVRGLAGERKQASGSSPGRPSLKRN